MRNSKLWVVVAASLVGCGSVSSSKGDGGVGDGAVGDGAGPDAYEGPVIAPGDPGAADLQLEVHGDQGRHPISPLIYGMNGGDDIAESRYRLIRLGGNRLTAYNWETNASNAGSDYQFQNDDYLSASNTPGQAVTDVITRAATQHAAVLLTVPIVDYVAADKNGGGDVRASGSNYLATRFRQNRALKGGALTLTPDATDGYVNQDEFVAWVKATYPSQRVIFDLDNEPDLWSSTHAEVHPDAVTYAELATRSAQYATMIKATHPTAEVAGFVSYGFNGYVTLQGAPDAGGRDFIDFFLGQVKAAGTAAGHRVVDYLDLHWYPEATGGGTRVSGPQTDAATVAARLEAPRSLWDPTYTETSWVATYLGQPVKLIPRIDAQIAAGYPGTKLSFSEWNFGAGTDISGALATADVLGVFGREGVAMATNWPLLSTPETYTQAAFRALLNYDGAGGHVGDTSTTATTSDVTTATVYGTLDAATPARVVIIAINKATASKTASLKVWSSTAYGKAKVYTVTAAGPQVSAQPDAATAATNAWKLTLPARSISVIVPQP